MKSLIFSRNGFVTLVMLVLILLAGRLGLLDDAGYSLYDNIRVLGQPPASNVLVVAIDEYSLDKIGRYPVPYETHIRLLENLISAGVELVAYVGLHSLNMAATGSDDTLSFPSVYSQRLADLVRDIRNQGIVAAGIPFVSTSEDDRIQTALPGYLLQNSLPNEQSLKLHSARPAYPLPESASGPAASYTSIFVENDVSKKVRSVPLFIEANGLLMPTLAMQLYLRVNNLRLSDVTFTSEKKLSIAGSTLLTDPQFQVWPYFPLSNTTNRYTVEVVSYHDVLHGAVSVDRLSGKIVLLGVTADGLARAVSTPTDISMPIVMVVAETLASMLDGKLISPPAWASMVSTVLLILVTALLLWLFSQELKARIIVTTVLVLILLGIEILFLLETSIWLNMYPPILLLLTGFLVTWLMGSVHKQVEKPNAMSGEVHRRVGLASQKRGELDAAFESFRKCPLENSIMVMLFYLAQDFEASGRFDRAVAVYQYMESFNPHFKELQGKLEKARMMEDTVMIDESKIGPVISTAITSLDLAEEKESDSRGKRLGRYLVQQEIGKGAMGMVYQGTDPKINRTVAIKTLNLKREFDEDEQENVLGRFFHEAEAAGRLHHPHIVTIYDAGEHDELAYIAMEFLTGSDLRVYTKKGTLLPPLTVVKIGMKLAGALFYAHSRDIVHRDIKAANVMFDPGTGQLKITDFGIARLTDSRRTKTGMVLGTPSSMSPEQLRGKKLDGRTDLYSLGVLMFQLLTGHLPYKADSLTQLMYKITNEPPPDLFALRPDLKENGDCIREILDKLLQKEADDRYQDGKKLARDLLACAKKMVGKK